MSFLSVGQGDCTVLRSDDLTVLIDVGPVSDTFDAGSRLVAPKLRQRGIDAVDLVILTHPDIDHIGGLAGLMSKVRVEKVAAAAYFRGHPDLERELGRAGLGDEDVLWLAQDARCRVGDAELDIRLPSYAPGDPDNEGSPFMRWSQGGHSAVMTGDASLETEAAEVGRDDWEAEILKAGHHGSSRATSLAWLRRVHPQTVVVSCGRHNRFGHPAAATLKRIAKIGAQVLRTDLDGDIDFERTAGGWVRVPR